MQPDLCGLSLQGGILEKYNVELIGAKLPSIDKAEDRELFKQASSSSVALNTPTDLQFGIQRCSSSAAGIYCCLESVCKSMHAKSGYNRPLNFCPVIIAC